MSGRAGFPLLPTWLLRLALGAATALILLVVLAPFMDNKVPDGHGARRLMGLFAHDPTVRRTAVASAIGLAATGWIFFRVRGPLRPSRGSKQPKAPAAPPPVVGA